jgi:16S rRNA (cytosine967-C5)-methyltransferase
MSEGYSASTADVPGLAARRLAAFAVDEVIRARTALDDTLERLAQEMRGGIAPQDMPLARAIATVTFRRFGTIRRAIDERLAKGSPPHGGPFEAVMATAAAQILFLDVPDHAAVDLAIRLLSEDGRSLRYAGLANAVLRRLTRERAAVLAHSDVLLDTPDWMLARWVKTYGAPVAAQIAAAHAQEPPLDLTLAGPLGDWPVQLDALVLPTGSLRLRGRTALAELPGYEAGAWWVQDASASLPARLLNVAPGMRVVDLCAAPGGKTMQLAAAGAEVTAVDRSGTRLKRVRENLTRMGLSAKVVTKDALAFLSEPFDGVLLDAPCSATGTIRRHPDVAWSKGENDLAKLVALQGKLLAKAGELTKSGGRLVYCTCSLEPEEGEDQVEAFLLANPDFRREPIKPAEIGGIAEAITTVGDLRALPFQLAGDTPRLSGWAGFYAARLIRL